MLMGGKSQGEDQQAGEAPTRRPPGIMPMLVPMVLGLVVGAAASWALLYPALEKATPWVDILIQIVLPALGIFTAALMLILPLAWWAIRRFIRTAHGTLEQVVREVAKAAQAATENDAPAATVHARQAALEAVAWYGPVATRRFVVQTALGLFVAYGGLVGTAMLFRQTILLGKQNAKLDLQTVTAEAQRRAGLAAELFSILHAVSLINVEAAGTAPSQRPTGQLPRGLQTRIAVLSRAATPYRIIEVPENATAEGILEPKLANRARSPERGQLLVGLALAAINIDALRGATFASADLRDADLTGTDLRGANLLDADLTAADLADADLRGAILIDADLRGASLRHANLRGASLLNADLTNAILTDADLTAADLTAADLTGAVVGLTDNPGQLPRWSGPPPGWELYDDRLRVRLRRRGAPLSEPLPR